MLPRREIFATPLILHILFAAVTIWRARNNYRVIVAVVLNDFNYIEPRGLLRQNGFWSWCWMFAAAIFDYHLIKTFGSALYDFITGHLWLRLRYGFRETEVVFRTPSNAAGSRLCCVLRAIGSSLRTPGVLPTVRLGNCATRHRLTRTT
jgi:hypothetical protein